MALELGLIGLTVEGADAGRGGRVRFHIKWPLCLRTMAGVVEAETEPVRALCGERARRCVWNRGECRGRYPRFTSGISLAAVRRSSPALREVEGVFDQGVQTWLSSCVALSGRSGFGNRA